MRDKGGGVRTKSPVQPIPKINAVTKITTHDSSLNTSS
jgi:hypothetical protein